MIDRNKCKVEVCDIEPFTNNEYKGFKLLWEGNIGFGEYTIYQCVDDPNKWKADSEYMDHIDDKWFIRKLFDNLIEQLEITE